MRRSIAVWMTVALAAVACGDTEPLPDGIEVAEGFEVSIAATGFEQPTQMARTPSSDIVIGELAGGENDAVGRIVRVDGSDLGERTILYEALDKPTGVAVVGERLWVMQRQSLWSGPADGTAPLSPVLVDMPHNGRSQGTLTVTPEGALLYDTSGSKRGATVTDGSGGLFVIDDPSSPPSEPRQIASGFKHAYAHAYTGDGRLWSVEMTDGTFDGSRASDELVIVEPGSTAGWPQCVDDNRPVIEFGGSETICSDALASHALFGPGATPTSIVVAPWDSGTLLVTLWIPGHVVAVPTDAADAPHTGDIIVSGIERPQSLLVDGDRVLIADHESGTIFALRPA